MTSVSSGDNRMRKWILIAVGAFAVVVLLLVSAIIILRWNLGSKSKTQIQALQKAGYPTTPTEAMQWYPSVPSNQNASVVYARVFPILTNYDMGRTGNLPFITTNRLPSRTQPLPEATRKEIQALMDDLAPVFPILNEASQLTNSRFPIDLSKGFDMPMHHLGPIRKSMQLLMLAHLLKAETGQEKEAVSLMDDGFALAQSLQREPLLIPELIRCACFSLISSTLERTANRVHWKEEELLRWQKYAQIAENPTNMVRALIVERAIGLNLFKSPPTNAFTTPANQAQMATGWEIMKLAGILDRDALYYMKCMETNIFAARLAPPDSMNLVAPFNAKIEQEVKRNYYIFSGMMLPALEKTHTRTAMNIANMRCLQAGLAIERYRRAHQERVPESLSELVPQFLPAVPTDPFDGKPLRYKILPKGYVVYSVGTNRVDDDGSEEKPKKTLTSSNDPKDIIFKVEWE